MINVNQTQEKRSKVFNANTVFYIFNAIFMIAFVIITLYPVLNTLAISFNDGTDAVRGGIHLLPRKFTLHNFAVVFRSQNMVQAAIVTVGRTVIGTLALMNKGNGNAVLKKAFVRSDHRKKGVLSKLYDELLAFANSKDIHTFIFDTPSVATDCHHFFEKRGYRRIAKDELPFEYHYPDRDSYVYMMNR